MQTETTPRNHKRNRNRNPNPNPSNPEKTMKTTLLAFVAFLLFVGATASAQNWIGGSGTWNDSTAANWSSPAAVPVNGGTVQLNQAAATDISIDYTATNLTGTGLNQLYLHHTGVAKTTFTLDGTGVNADVLPVSTYVSIGQWANGDVEFNLKEEATLSINGSNAFRLGIAGRTGTFTVNQSGGTLNNGVGGASLFYVGQGGTYNLSGTGTINSNRGLTVESGGTWNQTGGAANWWNGAVTTINGSFSLSSGSFSGTQSWVVGAGGEVNWTGGTMGIATSSVQLNGANSVWTMKGGSLEVNSAANPANGVITVASSTLQGYGQISDNKSNAQLNHSGRIVANGYGSDNTLDLSDFRTMANTTDNTTTNGWFAVNHGKLMLPNASVTSAAASYNWGEAAADTTIDLVNSARLTFAGLGTGTGTLTGALLAVDRSDVPAFAVAGLSRAELFSVHDLSLAGIAFTDFDLTIRYDDLAAAGFEDVLQIFHYTGGAWMPLVSTVDPINKWITATDIGSFSLFGVGYAVPEPASVLVLGLAGLLSLRRRR